MVPSVSQLATYAAAGYRVNITNQTISHSTTVSSAEAGYVIDSDGGAYSKIGTTFSLLETWKGSGVNSDYKVRATLVSGDTPSGTLNTWLDCAVDNTWTLAAPASPGALVTKTCVLTIEIQDDVSLETLDSASITLEAISDQR